MAWRARPREPDHRPEVIGLLLLGAAVLVTVYCLVSHQLSQAECERSTQPLCPSGTGHCVCALMPAPWVWISE